MSTEAVRRAQLGTVANIDMGRNYPADLRVDVSDESLPILGAGAQATSGRAPANVLRSSLGPRDVVVEPGDLAIDLNVPIGAPILVEEASLLSPSHARLRPMKGSIVTTGWLFVWASSSEFREQVNARARSLRSRITLQELRTFSVPLARREHQVNAFASLQQTLEATRLATRQLELLTELRAALVDRAVAQVGDEHDES